MAEKEKIKITKEDILNDNVELPEGYKFEKCKTKQEIRDEFQAEIDRLESELGKEPNDDILIVMGKVFHHYYYTQEQIECLEEQLKQVE